jgi:hypothetical protein
LIKLFAVCPTFTEPVIFGNCLPYPGVIVVVVFIDCPTAATVGYTANIPVKKTAVTVMTAAGTSTFLLRSFEFAVIVE